MGENGKSTMTKLEPGDKTPLGAVKGELGPIPVPMELLDAYSQGALHGWMRASGYTGTYQLALVPTPTEET